MIMVKRWFTCARLAEIKTFGHFKLEAGGDVLEHKSIAESNTRDRILVYRYRGPPQEL
jgi:hypothetical protein